MDTEENLVAETPDLEFEPAETEVSQNGIDSEEHVEQILGDIEQETPDLDFDEASVVQSTDEIPQHTEDDEDIDDLDAPDQYVDDDDAVADDTNDIDNDTDETSGDGKKTGKPKSATNGVDNRLVHLPIARVKQIMKVDPDVSLITGECTFLVAKATELFIESLARESFVYTAQAKKRTVQKRDVDTAIENVDSLTFLEGMMNF